MLYLQDHIWMLLIALLISYIVNCSAPKKKKKHIYTHTHTHTYICKCYITAVKGKPLSLNGIRSRR